jgi:hypothetical protein
MAGPIRCGGTKINSPEPQLTTVFAPYPTQPLLALFDPPVKRACGRPRCDLYFNGWIHFPAIGFAVLTRIEVHGQWEHRFDCAGKGTTPRPKDFA